jgi:hypothetical protein
METENSKNVICPSCRHKTATITKEVSDWPLYVVRDPACGFILDIVGPGCNEVDTKHDKLKISINESGFDLSSISGINRKVISVTGDVFTEINYLCDFEISSLACPICGGEEYVNNGQYLKCKNDGYNIIAKEYLLAMIEKWGFGIGYQKDIDSGTRFKISYQKPIKTLLKELFGIPSFSKIEVAEIDYRHGVDGKQFIVIEYTKNQPEQTLRLKELLLENLSGKFSVIEKWPE